MSLMMWLTSSSTFAGLVGPGTVCYLPHHMHPAIGLWLPSCHCTTSNTNCHLLLADHRTHPAISLRSPFFHSVILLHQLLFATIMHPAMGLWTPFCPIKRYLLFIKCYLLLATGWSQCASCHWPVAAILLFIKHYSLFTKCHHFTTCCQLFTTCCPHSAFVTPLLFGYPSMSIHHSLTLFAICYWQFATHISILGIYRPLPNFLSANHYLVVALTML